jgi:hypothetical protein
LKHVWSVSGATHIDDQRSPSPRTAPLPSSYLPPLPRRALMPPSALTRDHAAVPAPGSAAERLQGANVPDVASFRPSVDGAVTPAPRTWDGAAGEVMPGWG